MRCALTQSVSKEDWRRTTIFCTFAKCGEKSCKVIIDSGSYINVVSTENVKRLGFTTILHPQPYRVSWVDSSSIPVTHKCHVPIEFGIFKDKIWCNVVPKDVGHIILGQPWLFDINVTLYGRTNTCVFEFKGKKIKLILLSPKSSVGSKSLMDKGKDVKGP